MKSNLRNGVGAVMLLLLAAFPVLLTGCTEKQSGMPEPVVTPDTQPAAVAGQNIDRGPRQPERDPFLPVFGGEAAEAQPSQVTAAGRDPFMQVDNVTEPPVIEAPEPEPPVTEPSEPEPTEAEPDETEPPDDSVEVTTPGRVTLHLMTLDRCWLDVFVDNERVMRTNVPNGETLLWSGSEEITLDQVGRPGAVMVTLNGRQLGRLADMVPSLVQGPLYYDFDQTRVQITLGHRYSGGVLVGLRFTVVTN